jgi:ATP-dependent helicase HepA
MPFAPGQRWISLAEPELGLGTVLRIEGRTVQVVFAASGTLRAYATHAAPLQRAQFRPGDKISGGGRRFVVERVESHNGALRYVGAEASLSEGELDDAQDLSRADARLIAGRVDSPDRFDFRAAALMRRAEAPLTGLGPDVGAYRSSRINCESPRCRIAPAGARAAADEVGLGKTIEAGMILGQLLASGRIARVLVLLPEVLVYQWFVELLRRFNLSFAVFDEERCEAIELGGDGRNPFQDEQLVIADIALLRDSAKRGEQALEAGWDLLIVDEAHHLAWSPQATSSEYALADRLAQSIPNLILLTATPEQLGRTGHFARLRLLDPARYGDLERYQHEAEGYVELSRIVDNLQNAQPLGGPELTHSEHPARRSGADLGTWKPAVDRNVIDALIDRHGTGRSMFRSRRATVGGFPQRILHVTELDAPRSTTISASACSPSSCRTRSRRRRTQPTTPTIRDLLADRPGRAQRGRKIPADLPQPGQGARARGSAAHAQRRQAGALPRGDDDRPARPQRRVLRQAEVRALLRARRSASEGRNFQFAHNLILWDLPLDPDLLEQRIGRLDRIGQASDIDIHVAVFPGSAQQALVRWYDAGLDAFRSSPADGRELYRRFGERLQRTAVEHARGADESDAEIDSLVAETQATHAQLSR